MQILKSVISKIMLLAVIIFSLKPIYDIQIVSKQSQSMEIEKFFSNFDMTSQTNNQTSDGHQNISKFLLTTKGVLYIPSIDLKLPIYEGTSETAISEGTGLIDNTGDLSGSAGQCPIITSHNGISDKNLFLNLQKLREGDKYYIFESREKIHEYTVIDIRTVLPIDEESNMYKNPQKALTTLRTCTPTGINSHRLLVTGEKTADLNAMAIDTRFSIKNLSNFEMILGSVAVISFLILLYDIIKGAIIYVKKQKTR